MPSFKSRFFTFLLSLNKKLGLGIHSKNIDWNSLDSIIRFREQCENGATHARIPN
ncbi:MAG TPA: hypothetical protein VF941_00425 [Clostridia bacterium]